jgi:hypothetical protein
MLSTHVPLDNVSEVITVLFTAVPVPDQYADLTYLETHIQLEDVRVHSNCSVYIEAELQPQFCGTYAFHTLEVYYIN